MRFHGGGKATRGFAAARGKLRGKLADVTPELHILLLQSGDQLVAIDDGLEFGAIIFGALQYLFDGRAVFAFQAGNKVKALLDFGQALRVVLDIAFVTADAGGDIL